MKREELKVIVISCLQTVLTTYGEFTEETKLWEDIELDIAEYQKLSWELEKALGVKINTLGIIRLKYLGELIDYLNNLINFELPANSFTTKDKAPTNESTEYLEKLKKVRIVISSITGEEFEVDQYEEPFFEFLQEEDIPKILHELTGSTNISASLIPQIADSTLEEGIDLLIEQL